MPEPLPGEPRSGEGQAQSQPLPGGLPPGEPLPLGVALSPTGDPAVDAGLDRLAALDGVPTGSHAEVYEDVHQRLTDTLAALDRE